MPTKTFKHFEFIWHSPAIPRNARGVVKPDWSDVVRETELAVRGSVALTGYVESALKSAKVSFGEKPVEWARAVITPEPKSHAYFDPEPFLYADVGFDPLELRSLPKDRKEAGELFIGFVEQAVAKLSELKGFPVDVFREACDVFRARGYSYVFKAGEQKIPGTTLKGQVHAVVSTIDTERFLTVLNRGQEVLKVRIASQNGADFVMSQHFAGFERDGSKVTVLGGFPDPRDGHFAVESVDVDLAQDQALHQLLIKKGWI